MEFQNKRAHKRSPMSGLVSYESWGEGYSFKGKAHIVDISNGGVSFLVSEKLKTDRVFKISFWFPNLKDVHVPTLAKVMWTNDASGGSRAGLKFMI